MSKVIQRLDHVFITLVLAFQCVVLFAVWFLVSAAVLFFGVPLVLIFGEPALDRLSRVVESIATELFI